MKLKEFLGPLSFALLTTIAIQYFFFNKPVLDSVDTQTSGERLVAPKSVDAEVVRPLNLEVDFIDEKIVKKPTITKINTDNVRYVFSSAGASLEQLEFKRNWGGKIGYLSTVFPASSGDRERSGFLVALSGETPYVYTFLGKVEEQDRFIVSYSADTQTALVKKRFTVFKYEHRLDVELSVTPKNGATLRPRILFPSPLVPELGPKDEVSLLWNNPKGKIDITKIDDSVLEQYSSRPTLFGAQDRYFIHAMVSDPNYFAQRGYYKLNELNSVTTIVEGPEISEPAKWTLSFYVGPKEDGAITAVDSRLDTTLNYGFFGIISRPVSKVLLQLLEWFYSFLHNYGLAIMLVTILLKLIMLPFMMKAEQGQKNMAEFQRKQKHLEHSYKNDPEGLAKARAALLKEHGMPGLGSCLPMLIQIPFFIAFNWVISNSIELYMAPFLWIKDLSAPDPYYILPFFVALSIIASSLFMGGKVSAQQRLSSLGLGLVFGAFSSSFSAGLALFIATNAGAHAIQSYVTKR